MTEETKKDSVDHINLKVLGQDGQVVHFKIKQHTSLKKLMSAYCARSKMAQATVRFRFDGQPISENDTPKGLDMEDGDTIEVFQQQTGGGTLINTLAVSSKALNLKSNDNISVISRSNYFMSYGCELNYSLLLSTKDEFCNIPPLEKS